MFLDARSKQGPDDDTRASDSKTPLVSVIIPARNSECTIAECLRSIRAQSYKPIEILVVDSFSTDSTRDIAQYNGAFVLSYDGERSGAKNLGATVAKGKYLYFVDADHKLGPEAIMTCVESIDMVDGVLIRDQDLSTGSKVSRLIASRRNILSHDPLNVALRFVRKDAFESLSGFDLDLYVGEDLDFHKRFLQRGFRMAYSRVTEWHLGSPVDLHGLLGRSLYYSSNYLRYASKNPMISYKRLNPLRTVSAWKKSEVRGADLLPVVFLGFLSTAFLVIAVLLNRKGRGISQKAARGS